MTAAASRRKRRRLAALLAVMVGLAHEEAFAQAQAQARAEALTQAPLALVEFASLDQPGGRPVTLKGFWLPAPSGTARNPAVALFHGCGGALDKNGQLGQRLRGYAALLNQQGLHALVVDSLTPRGERELCTQRTGTRAVTQAHRRLDALAAIQWLAQRPEVDAERIGLLGWSNGGSTVLAATNVRQHDVAARPIQPAFAVAFYPGCEAELKRGYETRTPLLMLLGEADDWTPAAPCHQLARHAKGVIPQIEAYAGAYHGFDSNAPVRLRKEVPNGVRPGEGVHVGGDAEAKRLSRERLLRFVAEQLVSGGPAHPSNDARPLRPPTTAARP